MTPERKAELEQLAQKGLIHTGAETPAPRPKRCPRCSDSLKGREYDPAKGVCEKCWESANEERSQAALRAALLERDKGVCQEPGCPNGDCLALENERDRLWSLASAPYATTRQVNAWKVFVRRLSLAGFPKGDIEGRRTLWDAAHRKDRVRGGPDTIGNVTTKCLACHAMETASLAGDRAKARGSRWKKGRKRGR